MPQDFVEGWTEPINYQLLADGVAQNLTGMTVALVGYQNAGKLFPFGGSVSVTDAVNGKVVFTPAAADLVAKGSPYNIRWKVTDSLGKIAYFPNQSPEVWVVQLP